MTVEMRHQQRICLEFQVHIIYRRRLFQAAAANLSSEGMFLRTGATTIPTGTLIELEFGLGAHKWQIAGLVLRQSPGAIAILFRDPQSELFKLAGDIAAVHARPVPKPATTSPPLVTQQHQPSFTRAPRPPSTRPSAPRSGSD